MYEHVIERITTFRRFIQKSIFAPKFGIFGKIIPKIGTIDISSFKLQKRLRTRELINYVTETSHTSWVYLVFINMGDMIK